MICNAYNCVTIDKICIFSTLTTVFAAGALGKIAGHSMLKYVKAKTAIKSTFALLNRIPAIDVASVKGIALVR